MLKGCHTSGQLEGYDQERADSIKVCNDSAMGQSRKLNTASNHSALTRPAPVDLRLSGTLPRAASRAVSQAVSQAALAQSSCNPRCPTVRPAGTSWPGRLVGRLFCSAVLGLGLGLVAEGLAPQPLQAQVLRPEVRDPFLADPLADNPRDPLLPMPEVSRPLSPLELLQLEQALVGLDQSALALWQANQVNEALLVWIREVRLRRLLGLPEEIAAIQRVGGYAWRAGRTQEVQLLTARLRLVRQQVMAAQPLDQSLLLQVALGFEVLGEPTDAVSVYRQLADLALATEQLDLQRRYLEKAADLETEWFQFGQAAVAYRQLYQLPASSSLQQIEYLRREIRNLQQAQQFEAAIAAQFDLLAQYDGLALLQPVPELQRAMGQNYQALGRLEAAAEYYQAAYTNAITLEQFEVAAAVVDELVQIYRHLGQLEDALYLYEQQLLVARKVYSAYGLLETFDQMGQLYEQLAQPEKAIAAFREALVLARHLQHREDYFLAQIQRLDPSAVPPEASPTAPLPPALPLNPPVAQPWRQ